MRARAASFVLLLAALSFSVSSARASAWSLERGQYYSELQASQFSTLSGYTDLGNRYDFRTAGKLQQSGLHWRNTIGWRKKTSLLLGLSGMSVTGFEAPPTLEPSRSGLAEFELGLHYKLSSKPTSATAVEAGWVAPAGYDRKLSREFGDGRQQLYGLLAYGKAFGKLGFIDLSAGGSYRFHKLGSLDDEANKDPRMTTNVYWDLAADIGVWLKGPVLAGLRYRGQVMASTTGAGGPTNVHTVGPLTLTGDQQIDENVQLLGALLLYRLDERLDLMAGSYSTAGGTNTLHYDQFYIALAFKQTRLTRNQGLMGGTAP